MSLLNAVCHKHLINLLPLKLKLELTECNSVGWLSVLSCSATGELSLLVLSEDGRIIEVFT